jgi:hypothetical protein
VTQQGAMSRAPSPGALVPGGWRTSKRSSTACSSLRHRNQAVSGGGVKLNLYLLLTMMATQEPFDIRNPPTPLTLARTLALPQTTGPRRINDNLKWLEDQHFIERTNRPGQTAAIQLMDPDRPGSRLPNPQRSPHWITMPIEFWSCGWLLELSPTGIAVLFALTERLYGATSRST